MDSEIIYTEEFQYEFSKANKLFNKITYIETTPENLRELAKMAIKLAEMIENDE